MIRVDVRESNEKFLEEDLARSCLAQLDAGVDENPWCCPNVEFPVPFAIGVSFLLEHVPHVLWELRVTDSLGLYLILVRCGVDSCSK